MQPLTHRRLINRPPEQVFAALTDFASTPLWKEGVIDAGHTATGGVGMGTEVYEGLHGRLVGDVWTVATVTGYEINRRLVLSASMPAAGRTCSV